MFDELVTDYGNRFLVAALGVSLALLCLFIVLWLLRNRAPSPFVRGGRNRQPRLQVLDAAAVDARRRLVLVRRDNVEHLVMIGGPTDIVIESGIGDERGYLAATAVGDSAVSGIPDLADQRLPQAAATQRALERTETPPAAAMSVDSLLAGRPEATPAAHRPHATVSPAPAQTPAQAAMTQPAPAMAAVKPAAPVTAHPSTAPATQPQGPAATAASATTAAPAPTPASQPAPVADLRKVEAPRIEPAAPIAPKVEPSTATREAAPAVKSEGPKVDASAEKPQQAAPAASTAIPAPPVAAPARPAAPAVHVPTAAAEPATMAAPVVSAPARETRASEIPAAPVAFAAAAAPLVAPAVVSPARAGSDRAADPQIDAADILEAARQRVLTPAASQRDEPQFEPAAPEFQRRSSEQSEFEKVLEQEMALHLAAANDPQPKVATPFATILPDTRPDRPVVPPIATPVRADTNRPATTPAEEPDLQNEIARIFGEMSADRH